MTPAQARRAQQLRWMAVEHACRIADAVADGQEPDEDDIQRYRAWRDRAAALTTAGDRS